MKNCEYWIWLQRTLGTAARIDDIINYYGSAKTLYEVGSREWRLSGLLNNKQIEKLIKFSPSESGKIMKICSDNHWDIITPDDDEYPPLLRQICDYPAVLYVDGNSEILGDETFIAMVGTRNASQYGLKAACVLAQQLSKTGLTVVSGGALGVDSASHTGAINAGKKTVAVLGCGFGTDYLKENEVLRKEIVQNGALITEYPPFTAATRYTFPKRNRIISGMSLGTVVIEAGERSGSLITARLAMEQNRDVFAIPGNVFSSSFTGANRLIHDGAKPVFTAADIAEEYVYLYHDKVSIEGADVPFSRLITQKDLSELEASKPSDISSVGKRREKKSESHTNSLKTEPRSLPEDASPNAKAVYSAIDGESFFDDLVIKTGLPAFKIMTAVTELELKGVIEKTPENRYTKI